MSTAYHPQTSGMVERANQTCEQVLRCLFAELGHHDWESLLPMTQFVINSSPSVSTGYSPFFLNYGFHPVTPLEMLRDRSESSIESTEEFLARMDEVLAAAKRQMLKAQNQMKQAADKHRRDVHYAVGDKVLLSTQHLKLKDLPTKFARRFIGPFKVAATVGSNAYTLELPATWKIHPTFHVSLLKQWNESAFTSGGPIDLEDVPFTLDEG